jgi:hypothetical protein
LKGKASVKLPNGQIRRVELHWYEAHGIGRKDIKTKYYLGELMNTHKRRFAICIDNTDYAASLIVKKIYEVLPDKEAAKDELIRIVDESGEDYLYHISHFILVELPLEVEQALIAV